MAKKKYIRKGGPVPCAGCGRIFIGGRGQVFKSRHGGKVYCLPECLQASKPSRLERFLSHVDKGGPVPEKRPDLGPCWIWLGTKDQCGYGRFRENEKHMPRAHQWAYRDYRGPIPAKMHLHHLCETPACCNPWHLEAVKSRDHLKLHHPENLITLQTIGVATIRAKTHCKRGHERTPENTDNRGCCLPCLRLKQAERKSAHPDRIKLAAHKYYIARKARAVSRKDTGQSIIPGQCSASGNFAET